DLTWLAERIEDARFEAGDVLGRKGDPISHLNVILEGEIQVEFAEGPGAPRFIAHQGQITGALPFSRLKNYIGTARATLPLHVLRLHMQFSPNLTRRFPLRGYRVGGVMPDRIRETPGRETPREKLRPLDRPPGGPPHNPKNPAAAAQRAAKN